MLPQTMYLGPEVGFKVCEMWLLGCRVPSEGSGTAGGCISKKLYCYFDMKIKLQYEN